MPKIQLEKKKKAIALRLAGKSYNEIRRALDIPSKGTLSFWFRNLELSPAAQKRLAHNIFLAQKRGLLRFNKERSKRIENENKLARQRATQAVPSLSKAQLLLVGTALYWGEGFQSEQNKHSLGIRFVNSNPYMVALFLRFLREILKVKNEKIRPNIRIHPHIPKNGTILFWQRVTGLPIETFRITTQISGASKLKRPTNSLPYGTIDVRVNSRQLFYRMKGYIDGLSAQSGFYK